jgi:hypothetical protein
MSLVVHKGAAIQEQCPTIVNGRLAIRGERAICYPQRSKVDNGSGRGDERSAIPQNEAILDAGYLR